MIKRLLYYKAVKFNTQHIKLNVQSALPHIGHLKPSSGKSSSSKICPHLLHLNFIETGYIFLLNLILLCKSFVRFN